MDTLSTRSSIKTLVPPSGRPGWSVAITVAAHLVFASAVAAFGVSLVAKLAWVGLTVAGCALIGAELMGRMGWCRDQAPPSRWWSPFEP